MLLAKRWSYYRKCYKHKIPSIVKIIRRIGNPITAKIFVPWTKTPKKLKKSVGPLYDYEYTGNLKNEGSSDKRKGVKNLNFSATQTGSEKRTTHFLISNTFISNVLNGQKFKQKLSNTIELNFWQTCPKRKLYKLVFWTCLSKIQLQIVIKMKVIMAK